jgi:hypothetical protein
MVRQFEFDSTRPGRGYILYGCGPEMGPKWEFVENNFPAATDGVINNEADINQIHIPSEPKGYFRNYLEINRKVNKAIGKETYLGAQIIGPFTCAAFLRKYDNLLMDMVLDPDFFSKIMKKGEEISLFIGRHVMDLGYSWTNLLEIFLIPGVINPDTYHRLIAPHCDHVRNQLSTPPIPNPNAAFMGSLGDPDSYEIGKRLYEYHFGTAESLETIREASQFMAQGYPRQVSLSGNALVHWPIDRILDFLKQGIDFFIQERREYPFILIPSLQAENQDQASEVAEKLYAIAEFRNAYTF